MNYVSRDRSILPLLQLFNQNAVLPSRKADQEISRSDFYQTIFLLGSTENCWDHLAWLNKCPACNWQRLCLLPFLSLYKSMKLLKTKKKHILSLTLKRKLSTKKSSKIFGANMVSLSICPKLSSILLTLQRCL